MPQAFTMKCFNMEQLIGNKTTDMSLRFNILQIPHFPMYVIQSISPCMVPPYQPRITIIASTEDCKFENSILVTETLCRFGH